MSSHDQEKIAQATEIYRAVRDLPVIEELRPSTLWLQHIRSMQAMKLDSLPELVRDVTENDRFSFPRHNTDLHFHFIIDQYKNWFTQNHLPLGELDSMLQESPFASPLVTTSVDGRLVSTVFLYHLATAWRCVMALGGRGTQGKILELGGGHGGLARSAKLLAPRLSYFILDIPESLWFSYLFLTANFPDAKIIYCSTVDQVRDAKGYDFVLVPLPLIEGLFGQDFDLIANTASLGEMTDASAARYMSFIHEDITTRFFYSNNRYGQLRRTQRYTGIRRASPDAAKVPVRLDPYWRLLKWNLFPNNFILFDPNAPPSLELLAERVPVWALPLDYRVALAERLLREANLVATEDARWHFLVWESVRLHTTSDNLLVYLDFLARHGFDEFYGYRDEFTRLTGKFIRLPGEKT